MMGFYMSLAHFSLMADAIAFPRRVDDWVDRLTDANHQDAHAQSPPWVRANEIAIVRAGIERPASDALSVTVNMTLDDFGSSLVTRVCNDLDFGDWLDEARVRDSDFAPHVLRYLDYREHPRNQHRRPGRETPLIIATRGHGVRLTRDPDEDPLTAATFYEQGIVILPVGLYLEGSTIPHWHASREGPIGRRVMRELARLLGTRGDYHNEQVAFAIGPERIDATYTPYGTTHRGHFDRRDACVNRRRLRREDSTLCNRCMGVAEASIQLREYAYR